MPKVHKRKANKNGPAVRAGVCKPGEHYFTWSFYRGATMYSSVYPARHQLTRSPFLSAVYLAEDDLAETVAKFREGKCEADELAEALDSARSAIQEASEAAEEALDAIMEHFPTGNPTTELIDERMSACDTLGEGLEEQHEVAEQFTEATQEAEAEALEGLEGEAKAKALKAAGEATAELRDQLASDIEGLEWEWA